MTADGAHVRVLHVVDSLGVGGTEMGVANVIEGTRDRVHHIVVCVRQNGAVGERLAAGGTEIIVLGKKAGNDWRLPLRIAAVCRRVIPDIVHTRNWGSIEGILGARLARVPVVIHGEHGREISDPEGRNRRRNLLRRALVPFVNRIVTVSDQLRSWLVHQVGIPAHKVLVLRNGVNVERFRPRGDRDARRAVLGFSPTDVVVGTVGRLDPVKDQAAILDALDTLVPMHANVRGVIVGDGPEHARLRRQIEARGLQHTVQLLGERDDVPELLSLMDIFVLPSIAEGMCNTILEAMAAGLPVIATAVGGNPEMVDDDVTGMLVSAGNPNSLAAAIARYTGADAIRRQHGAAGRARVARDFSLRAMVERYLSLYQTALGQSRRGITNRLFPEKSRSMTAARNDTSPPVSTRTNP